MTVKYFNFRVPHGMALQPYNDGSYNILYDESRTVQLRDLFASLTNTLTDTAVQYLEAQKADEERKHQERAERARTAAFPVSRAAGLEKEKQRVNNHVDMMGNEEVPEAVVLAKPTTLKPPKPPLIMPKPNRVVKTTKGPLEVAPDVSDDDIRGLGYVIIEGAIATDAQNTTDSTSTADVALGDSPEEATS